jgi:hypothetical protein
MKSLKFLTLKRAGFLARLRAVKQIEQQPEDVAHVATLRQAYDSTIDVFLANLGAKRLNQEFG